MSRRCPSEGGQGFIMAPFASTSPSFVSVICLLPMPCTENLISVELELHEFILNFA